MNHADYHSATGLHYDGNGPPQVTWQGEQALALKIIEDARDKKIPILKHPALADALQPVSVGSDIPEDLYLIIAEILAMVYKLEDRDPRTHARQPAFKDLP